MNDYLVLQKCNHRIVQGATLVNDRILLGLYPIGDMTNVLVKYGPYKIPAEDYLIRQEGSSNRSFYFRITFDTKRRLLRDDWAFSIVYTTNIDFCPKCNSSDVVNELRLFDNGNYKELEFPNNYVQHLFYVIFLEKGSHPFYDFLGTYLNDYVLSKEIGNLELEIRDAAEQYNKLRAVYGTLSDEPYTSVAIANIDFSAVTEQYVRVQIYTNIQSSPITVGVSL